MQKIQVCHFPVKNTGKIQETCIIYRKDAVQNRPPVFFLYFSCISPVFFMFAPSNNTGFHILYFPVFFLYFPVFLLYFLYFHVFSCIFPVFFPMPVFPVFPMPVFPPLVPVFLVKIQDFLYFSCILTKNTGFYIAY